MPAKKRKTKAKASSKPSISTKFRFILFPAVTVILLLAAVTIVSLVKSEDSLTAQVTAEPQGVENTIRLPESSKPWPNSVEGSIVIWTKPPVEVFEQFSDSRAFILFFSATNDPKVRINYNILEKRFEAGSPIIVTPEIDIFAGQAQQLVYAFKQGVGQRLFLNGKMVAESEFKPPVDTILTGFSVVNTERMEVFDLPSTDVEMYDSFLSGADLNN